MQDILVIDLNIIPMECGICELRWEESRSAPTFGVARYEDRIVPDDYTGEWGGMPVCEECYRAERELRKMQPSGMITFREVFLASRRTT